MFKALLHHLGRAVDKKGRELFTPGNDCREETEAEVTELDERLESIERRLQALDDKIDDEARRLEEKIDQPDWRERR